MDLDSHARLAALSTRHRQLIHLERHHLKTRARDVDKLRIMLSEQINWLRLCIKATNAHFSQRCKTFNDQRNQERKALVEVAAIEAFDQETKQTLQQMIVSCNSTIDNYCRMLERDILERQQKAVERLFQNNQVAVQEDTPVKCAHRLLSYFTYLYNNTPVDKRPNLTALVKNLLTDQRTRVSDFFDGVCTLIGAVAPVALVADIAERLQIVRANDRVDVRLYNLFERYTVRQ